MWVDENPSLTLKELVEKAVVMYGYTVDDNTIRDQSILFIDEVGFKVSKRVRRGRFLAETAVQRE